MALSEKLCEPTRTRSSARISLLWVVVPGESSLASMPAAERVAMAQAVLLEMQPILMALVM